MKLYMHPASTTCRPILMLIADFGLDVEHVVVDIMTGAHHQPDFVAINPNRQVPVLDDGDFRLTESAAILRYLAEKHDLPVYPKDLQKRARVNEAMDWFNANFYRDWGYNFLYPQLFPHHKRPSDEVQAGTIQWGKEKAKKWLGVLDTHFLGDGRPYLCGDEITLADYFGGGLTTLGDLIGCDYGQFPNVDAWLGRIRGGENWEKVNEVFHGVKAHLSSQTFDAL